jgi:hypothetical protein
MSKIEIKFAFNKGARPDKEKVSSLASHALRRFDIGHEGGKVHAGLASTYTITAEGATGIDLDTLVMLGFVPGDHTAQIRVHRHPDGPAAAARWAGELAGRIAEAFNVRTHAEPAASSTCARIRRPWLWKNLGRALEPLPAQRGGPAGGRGGTGKPARPCARHRAGGRLRGTA